MNNQIFPVRKDLWKLRYLTRKQNFIYSNMFGLHLLKKKSFGIDLGNNNTQVSDQEKILVDQPSYIVLDKSRSGVKAVGNEAYDMFEKTHHLLKPVRPLKGGVIADHTSATKMISALMQQAYGSRSMLSGYENIISGVPFATTNVEKRALRAALEQFNATSIHLLYEPLAAAIGMNLNIEEPNGKMVVDIGGGITEIVVVSLSGIACFQSVKVAGDTMDEEIQLHFRRNYNMAIGLKTAEQIKIGVGAVQENIQDVPAPMMVRGKDMLRGLPVTRQVSHAEVAGILDKSISAIELSILQTLEKCPPELAGDIYGNGVHLTGGNAMLRGLKDRLEKKIRLTVHIDKAPLHAVSKGVATALRDPKKYRSVLMG
jgi:rod shape-determining protein MreB and related proteins